MKRERAKCPECCKEMAVAPPYGGDGSIDVFPRHYSGRRPSGNPIESRAARCAGSRWDVRDEDYVR